MTKRFEWDVRKAAENVRKHGVTFDEATFAFDDPFNVERLDSTMTYGEERWKLVGMAQRDLLVVIYTERDDRTRIISAREAAKHDRDFYYQNNKKGR
jgi:uncharacterized DUF497 family protein